MNIPLLVNRAHALKKKGGLEENAVMPPQESVLHLTIQPINQSTQTFEPAIRLKSAAKGSGLGMGVLTKVPGSV